MIKIFCLTSGRTGTKYLSYLFKNNIENCISKHEPPPNMFGKSIYWYQNGDKDKIKELFKIKLEKINNYNVNLYVETNHSFLKSFSDVAIEFFPDMKLVHAIRDPLKVAKSNFNRYEQLRKIRYPLNYRGDDGKKYIKWTLTGNEEIYKFLNFNNKTIYQISDEDKIYQYFILEWIETEKRAIDFLNKYNKHNDCYILDVPKDLNNAKKVKDMFNFFNLKMKRREITFKGNKNKGKKKTIVTEHEKNLFNETISKLPKSYLKIFKDKPYVDFKWGNIFSKY
ncbi:MAG: hypothetical protein AYK22_08625 [Thermoplasmatales archaeon SG8-52-3]|nr:MAG: hypothetical protein AYK22_08625 [Thermoplasmatales archaeon SG8-52-3]